MLARHNFLIAMCVAAIGTRGQCLARVFRGTPFAARQAEHETTRHGWAGQVMEVLAESCKSCRPGFALHLHDERIGAFMFAPEALA